MELEKRVTKLENSKTSINISGSLEKKILQKIDDIGIQHLVLLALKLKSKQSKNSLQTKLEQWNKPIGTWFSGGNFNKRLLKTALIIKDGKNQNNEILYSLGRRGIKNVKELIKKYNL